VSDSLRGEHFGLNAQFAPMDLPSLADNPALKNLLGATFEQNPRIWRDASPMTHVGADTVPFLMLHGTRDQEVAYAQSVNMQADLASQQVMSSCGENRYLGVRNIRHHFDDSAYGSIILTLHD
jgi:hypothetical protein